MQWNDVQQWEASIAPWVFHNLPWIYKGDWRSFWQHLQAHYGQHHIITTKNNSQISLKISAFNQPLCTENMMLCGKERHTLLLEGFLTGIWVSGFWREAKKSSRELARTVRGQKRSRHARGKSAKLRSDARNIYRKVKNRKNTLAREITRTNAR